MRFLLRHVQQTLADHVETGLTNLGWVNEPRVFGLGEPLTFQDTEPDVDERVEDYIVAVVLPDVGPNQAFEMGGGLRHVVYDLNVHVRTPRQAITASVAQDVVDLLTDEAVALYDYTSEPRQVVSGAQIEFEIVVIDRPTGGGVEFRRPWRVVTALANLYMAYDPVEPFVMPFV